MATGNTTLGVPIQLTIKRDVLYLDPTNADMVINDMKTQFAKITTSLNNIDNLLDRAVKKKIVTGSYAKAFTKWSNKAKSQANAAQTRSKSLEKKYLADTQDYVMKMLSDRIVTLETRINELEQDLYDAKSNVN